MPYMPPGESFPPPKEHPDFPGLPYPPPMYPPEPGKSMPPWPYPIPGMYPPEEGVLRPEFEPPKEERRRSHSKHSESPAKGKKALIK